MNSNPSCWPLRVVVILNTIGSLNYPVPSNILLNTVRDTGVYGIHRDFEMGTYHLELFDLERFGYIEAVYGTDLNGLPEWILTQKGLLLFDAVQIILPSSSTPVPTTTS